MEFKLAEMIPVICHVSAWLRDPVDPAPGLESMRRFKDVKSIRFEFEPSPGNTIEAADSATWMTQLAQREVDRLWLVTELSSEPPQQGLIAALFGRPRTPLPADPQPRVAFTGRGSWAVLGSSPLGHELWRAREDVGDRDDPDGKRWQIQYTGTPVSNVSIEPPAIDDAQTELLAALEAARQFAAGDEPFWAGKFSEALALAAPDVDPPAGLIDTLLPRDGYSLAARRLLAISTKSSDVFGGMGSWNDLSYSGGLYRDVSDRLYAATNKGFVSAVNSPLETLIH